jgi:sugar/nucleoside kinase (ribokinase family)
VKLAFQPGIFQMQFGTEKLKEIYARTDLFFCNVEEAQRILGETSHDLPMLMKKMAALGPKQVAITDGINGAYAYDGTDCHFMPVYPHVPFERTGAGDAFASTMVSALAMGKSFAEALSWGPINSMSVVQYVGAQKGLLSREKLEEYLKNAPTEYVLKKI